MKYSIRANEVKNKEGNIRGFATVVFGGSFKINNIAILENKEKGQLFVSMSRYKTIEPDENGNLYKDICNPITREFREEVFGSILETFENMLQQNKEQEQSGEAEKKMPEFSVAVSLYEKEGSKIRGIARIYFEDCFIVNSVNILQGKEGEFVAMPSYKIQKRNEQGKQVYQEVCYPITKEFRDRLYKEIIGVYEWEQNGKDEQDIGISRRSS